MGSLRRRDLATWRSRRPSLPRPIRLVRAGPCRFALGHYANDPAASERAAKLAGCPQWIAVNHRPDGCLTIKWKRWHEG